MGTADFGFRTLRAGVAGLLTLMAAAGPAAALTLDETVLSAGATGSVLTDVQQFSIGSSALITPTDPFGGFAELGVFQVTGLFDSAGLPIASTLNTGYGLYLTYVVTGTATPVPGTASMVITYSTANLVLFAETNLSTLKNPENAKNCLAVAASGDAPNQEFHCDGAAGPTADGRRKPEIMGPGCGIVSAKWASAVFLRAPGWGNSATTSCPRARSSPLVKWPRTRPWPSTRMLAIEPGPAPSAPAKVMVEAPASAPEPATWVIPPAPVPPWAMGSPKSKRRSRGSRLPGGTHVADPTTTSRPLVSKLRIPVAISVRAPASPPKTVLVSLRAWKSHPPGPARLK